MNFVLLSIDKAIPILDTISAPNELHGVPSKVENCNVYGRIEDFFLGVLRCGTCKMKFLD